MKEVIGPTDASMQREGCVGRVGPVGRVGSVGRASGGEWGE